MASKAPRLSNYLRPLNQQIKHVDFSIAAPNSGVRIMIHLNGPLSPYLIDQYRKFQNNNIILAA
jgi:hypothetical protein